MELNMFLDIHDIAIKSCSGNKTWDLTCTDVNLTVKSDSFVCKQNPSVDAVANVIDVVWKQEDQKKCLPTFCNLKVSQFEIGLYEEVNLTVKSDSFVSNDQIQSTHGDDQIKSTHGNDQLKSTHGDDQIKSTHGDDQIKSTHGDDQLKSTHGNDQLKSTHGDDQIKSTYGDDQIKSTHGNDQIKSTHGNDQIQSTHGNDQIQSTHGNDHIQSTHGMNLVLLLRALCKLSSATTLGRILVLGLLLSPFYSLSNAKKLDGDCLQTSVSGFVDNGEDLVLHCKCNCLCLHSWRWSGGPNNDDLTNNQQVLSSYIDKINITQNPPGVHDYSMILKATETDFFSSDYTCHNGFATKQINRSDLVQHVSSQPPPIQSTVTPIMSTLQPPKKNNNSKMSDGEIVGMVVGSVLGVLVLVVAVAVLLVKRKCIPPKKEEMKEVETCL